VCALVGFVEYSLLIRAFFLIMYFGFECEAIGPLDQIFIYEQNDNRHIILGCGFCEKFDFVTMKQYLLEKTE